MWRWLFLLIILCSKTALSQDFLQTFYDTNNGLIDNSVRSIMQDSRGFMWFITDDGVSRFDGVNFKNYPARHDSPLAFGPITNLTETKPGHLAFRNETQSLAVLNTYTDQFYRPADFIHKEAWSIYRLSANRYVVSANDSCFVTDQDLKITDTLVLPPHTKNAMQFGNRLYHDVHLVGVTWAPSERYLFNGRTNAFSKLTLDEGSQKSDHLAFGFYDKGQKRFYFTNYFGGVYRFSSTGMLLKKWSVEGFGVVWPWSDSTLLICSSAFSRGALLLNLKDDKIMPLKINDTTRFESYRPYADKDGNCWLGTDMGVVKFTLRNQFIKTYNAFGDPGSLQFPASLIKGKDGNLYVATLNFPRLYKFDRKADTWKLLSENRIPPAWCLSADGDDIVITGGQTMRFTSYNPLADTYKQSSDFLRKYFPKSDVFVIAFRHSNGDHWYSANHGGGFVRISARDGSIHHYTKDGPKGHFRWSYYATYVEDPSGDLWFGVDKSSALLHWHSQTDRFTEVSFDTVPGANGVHVRGINQIIRDKYNNLWISFEGTGLLKYDFTHNRSIRYTMEDGLASNYINSMAFDGKGRLWIGTPKGLSCLLAKENRIQTFTKDDGLFDDNFKNRFVFYDETLNELWAGATTSVTRFDPDRMLKKKSKMDVYIDEVYVNGIRATSIPDGNLHLSYKENNIQFRCAAVNLDGKPVQFSYRLKANDSAWVDNLSSTISFANLESGTYDFTIRVNYKGDTTQFFVSQPLTFEIATPWFRTWPFRLLVLTAFLFSNVFFVRRYYAQKNEKQRTILEKQQAVEKERTRIATDMHDDFGSSLSRIKFISEKIKLKSDGEPGLVGDLSKISAYSDEMAEKLNEIVWALNERYDTLDDLVSFTRAYAADYLTQHKIELNFKAGDPTHKQIKGEVRRNIFLILKEALHNTAKHAAATRVGILIEQDQLLRITYTDNGRGFNPQNVRPFANGLSNMRKRMSDIGGVFEIVDLKGTSIHLSVRI